MDINRELSLLNSQQREAVIHNTSPLLILAGAGSGKTRVITVKIAYLIEELGVDPREILAVTFTNKAAQEMKERASQLAATASWVTIRTFHSFGAYILRRYAEHLGLSKNFTIYDDADSLSILQEILPETGRPILNQYNRAISSAKDQALFPDDDLELVTIQRSFPEVYRNYQNFLKQTGNVDFGDLMIYPLKLLREHADVRQDICTRYRYIFVDEYQDSNKAQFELLRLLVGKENIISVVGDDDQSIYRFRGAEVRNILDFPSFFANTRVVCLEQNYRSTTEILQVATAVVQNNENRYGKKLYSERSSGIKPGLYVLQDEMDEVRHCIDYIKEQKRQGKGGVTAILYRTNAQSRIFETELSRVGIAYRIIGSMQFWLREEIKDILSYLSLLVNPRDLVAFRRISRKFIASFGTVSYEKISKQIEEQPGVSILDLLRQLPKGKKSSRGVESFIALYERLQEADEGPLPDRLTLLIESSGIIAYFENKDPERLTARVENLDELIHAAHHYGSGDDELLRFLESAELNRQELGQEEVEQPPVALITMHSTKGLEFDRVIITGMEDELFPGKSRNDEIEDERRLFYVAITRAKDELFLTSCQQRFLHRRMEFLTPSRFLAEIPIGILDVHQQRGRKVRWQRSGSDEWKSGSIIQHDVYGKGKIIDVVRAGKRNLIIIRFDDGKIRQFLPEYVQGLSVIS